MSRTTSTRFAFVVVVLLLLVGATETKSSPIDEGDFSGNETLIDFETIMAAELITTQFSGQGVTFSGGLYGDSFPNTSIQGNQEATNFLDADEINNPITAEFNPVQFRVGMLVGGQTCCPGDQIQVDAFSGAALVDSQVFETGDPLPGGNRHSVFAGLEVPRGFDRIEISRITGNLAFAIDDFRFEPEFQVPAVSRWGRILLVLLLLTITTAVLLRRRSNASDA